MTMATSTRIDGGIEVEIVSAEPPSPLRDPDRVVIAYPIECVRFPSLESLRRPWLTPTVSARVRPAPEGE